MHGSFPVRYLVEAYHSRPPRVIWIPPQQMSKSEALSESYTIRDRLPRELTAGADHGGLPAVDGISMPPENGVNYFRVAEAIASCAIAPSSFACVCIAAICDFANSDCSARTSLTSLARTSFCAKSKAAFTLFSANDMALVIASLALDGSVSAASVAFCAAPMKPKIVPGPAQRFFQRGR